MEGKQLWYKSSNPTLFEASDWWKASNCGTLVDTAIRLRARLQYAASFVRPAPNPSFCTKNINSKFFLSSCLGS